MAGALLRTRRRQLLAVGGVTAGAALLYYAYHSETYAQAKQYAARVKKALLRYSDGFLTAAELSAEVLEDLRQYVHSHDSELPQSVCQVLKLLQSDEVSGATRALIAAAVRGVFASRALRSVPSNGHAASNGNGSSHALHAAASQASQPIDGINIQLAAPDSATLVDKALQALTAPRGLNLVELVVRVATRNSVKEYCKYLERSDVRAEAVAAEARGNPSAPQPPPGLVQQLLTFLSTPLGQRLATSCTHTFVSSGMEVYGDKFGDVDTWDQLVASISKPEHRGTIERLTSVFVTDCIKAYCSSQRPDGGQERNSWRSRVSSSQPAVPAGQHQTSARCRLLPSMASRSASLPAALPTPDSNVSDRPAMASCTGPLADAEVAKPHPAPLGEDDSPRPASVTRLVASASSPPAPTTPDSQQPGSGRRAPAGSAVVNGSAAGEGSREQSDSHAQPARRLSAGGQPSTTGNAGPARPSVGVFVQEEQDVRWQASTPDKKEATPSFLAGFVQQVASHPEGRAMAIACCGQIGYQAAAASWEAATALTFDCLLAARDFLAAAMLALVFGHVSKATGSTNGSVACLSSGYVRLTCLMLVLALCAWWMGLWQRYQQPHTSGLETGLHSNST